MPVMNSSSVRVVDPILSTHVRGYKQAGLVGSMLFPEVDVEVSGGKVIEFGLESFQRYSARRAPGGATKRIQFGHEGKPFALHQEALEAVVPREWQRDALAVPGIDLARRAVDTTMRVITLGLEVEQAGIATNANNYDADHKSALAGVTKWSASTGTPLTDISDAAEAIRTTVGVDPNTLILGATAWNAAKNNPQCRARVYADQPDTDRGPVTLAQFMAAIDIPNVAVGKAISADDAGAFSDVWGNNAILAYVPPPAEANQAAPAFAYTYRMRGHPLVEQPYWDNGSKGWVYGVTYERVPVLTGMLAGFLFQAPA